ncbi:uncharacterized protein KY384_002819 [Bacidia gigantensis]|uniref:uncharacterized protein n=1 Tax=Bacidia gigantensis TaxID=2732470 RepID=UPI001D057D86|nr:uncharacterized protein KY384_002819 [Bacidia gigantensis]KAG8532941.1 hypothetical protein KY384_002819 [Bacidia gigantensis]
MSYYDACNAMRGLLEYSEKNQKGIYMEKAFLVIRYPRRQKQTLGAGDMLYDESVTTPALAAPTMLTQRDNQELRRQEVKNALQNVLNGGYADCLPQTATTHLGLSDRIDVLRSVGDT